MYTISEEHGKNYDGHLLAVEEEKEAMSNF